MRTRVPNRRLLLTLFALGTLLVSGSVLLRCGGTGTLPALVTASSGVKAIQGISAGPDQTLTYSTSTFVNLPDEHTTIWPPASAGAPYVFIGATRIAGGAPSAVGAFLSTTDLVNFTGATGYNTTPLASPVAFTSCNASYDSEFDENYAAPGSVLQDPTLPPGNLIMIYEAENHCPGGVWQQPFYASVGLARSTDNGVTWPAPIASNFGSDRYPAINGPDPEPASEPTPAPMGDALPSGFVDGTYLYVVYSYYAPPGAPVTAGRLQIARAALGGSGQLAFQKWSNGSFSAAGLGGTGTPVLPTTNGNCTGGQHMGSISYVEPVGLYLLTYVCGVNGGADAAWFYSTATSLEKQDWTAPTLISGSQFAQTRPCPSQTSGSQFDGWYPSFMSPGYAPGHLGLSGRAFFLNGCDTSNARAFTSRTFAITAH